MAGDPRKKLRDELFMKMRNESMLRSYVRLILEEAESKPVRLGGRMATSEERAKAEYEKALSAELNANLQKEDYEYLLKIRDGFLNGIVPKGAPDDVNAKIENELTTTKPDFLARKGKGIEIPVRIKADSEKKFLRWLRDFLVTSGIKKDLAMVDDDYIGKTEAQRQKIVSMADQNLQKAKFAYSEFDSAPFKYEKISPPAEDKTSLSPEEVKGLFFGGSPNKNPLEWKGGGSYANQWNAWPDNLVESGLDFKSGVSGQEIGGGEVWLAWLFGGKLMGTNYSYDVQMPDGTRCEVKEIKASSDTIRPGTEGLKAFEPAREVIEYHMRLLREFARLYRAEQEVFDQDFDTQPEEFKNAFQFIVEFTEAQYVNVVSKSEISASTFQSMRNAFKAVKNLKSYFKRAAGKKIIPKIKFADRDEITVTEPTFIDVINRIEKEQKTDIFKDEQKLHLALNVLKGSAFDNPDEFFNQVEEMIDLSAIFSEVSGVFVVNDQKGFFWIPKSNLNKYLRLFSISQGKPKLSFNAF